MYYFLSLLTGVLISGMVAINGKLTTVHGAYTAAILIHVTGLLLISAILLFRRENPFTRRFALPFYLGGAIGVFQTVANNLAFTQISLSAILGLGLLGQSIIGLVIDHYGLLGMPKYAFRRQKIIGLLLILGGIAAMIDNFAFLAVLLSLISGVCVVFSRTFNAKLADATNVRVGAFYNFLVGLCVTIPVFFLLGGHEVPALAAFTFSPHWYIYTGGIVGVAMILLCNMTVMKVSAFYLSLFSFLGQVSAGILIDALLDGSFSLRNLIGGAFVTAGLVTNLLIDRKMNKLREAGE
ncbi:MAG: DMT family transporter [Firmicutes bacterium]|nr:DMT family transporter [Bacillota bacterium]